MVICKKVFHSTRALYAKNTVYNCHVLRTGQMQQFSGTGIHMLCSSVLQVPSIFQKGEQK